MGTHIFANGRWKQSNWKRYVRSFMTAIVILLRRMELGLVHLPCRHGRRGEITTVFQKGKHGKRIITAVRQKWRGSGAEDVEQTFSVVIDHVSQTGRATIGHGFSWTRPQFFAVMLLRMPMPTVCLQQFADIRVAIVYITRGWLAFVSGVDLALIVVRLPLIETAADIN